MMMRRIFILSSLASIISWTSILPMTGSTLTSAVGNLDRCGGRLERALDALQRDSPRRNRLDEEEAGIVYQQKLVSAPLEMTVSRITVKLPQDSRNRGGLWARVERCSYEPKSNALHTRVMFADLSVSGVISLLPQDYRAPIIAESCRMSLRLRRAGIEFYTSPIARGRGQMRIRTESSFLEPRFASIYAYGCRPTRVDKQIKRYDKWPQPNQNQQQATAPSASASPIDDEPYEAPEPRGIAGLMKEEDVTIANEDARFRSLYDPDDKLDVSRKNVWVTKIPRRRKRRRSIKDVSSSTTTDLESSPVTISSESVIPKKTTEKSSSTNSTKSANKITDTFYNDTAVEVSNETNTKSSLKRETTLSQLLYRPDVERREREYFENDFDQSLSDEITTGRDDDWPSREAISNEMEDIFLRGASQALTRYIERELHPAIKETLMLSMGYTISYG